MAVTVTVAVQLTVDVAVAAFLSTVCARACAMCNYVFA